MNQIVPVGHVCNPPFTRQDDKRWQCGACRKKYWFDASAKHWQLLLPEEEHCTSARS